MKWYIFVANQRVILFYKWLDVVFKFFSGEGNCNLMCVDPRIDDSNRYETRPLYNDTTVEGTVESLLIWYNWDSITVGAPYRVSHVAVSRLRWGVSWWSSSLYCPIPRGDTMLKFDFFGNFGFHRSWYRWIFFSFLLKKGYHWKFIHGQFRKISRNISPRNSGQKFVESQVKICFFDF